MHPWYLHVTDVLGGEGIVTSPSPPPLGCDSSLASRERENPDTATPLNEEKERAITLCKTKVCTRKHFRPSCCLLPVGLFACSRRNFPRPGVGSRPVRRPPHLLLMFVPGAVCMHVSAASL